MQVRSAMVLMAVCVAGAAQAGNVSGTVSGAWTLAGSPYVVTGDVLVAGGTSLTLEAGVQVRFAGHFRFTINGTLAAIGSDVAPVVFTRDQPTLASRGWGLRFINATAAQSVLRNCLIEWGLADDGLWNAGNEDRGGGVYVENSNVLIDACEIRNNHGGVGAGVYTQGAAPVTISNSRLHDNVADVGGTIFSGGGGIGADGPVTIRNNLIYRNVYSAGNTANYEGGGGVALFNSTNAYVINNVVWGNTSGKGPGIHVLPFGASVQVLANNIVWGNTGAVRGEQISVEASTSPGGVVRSSGDVRCMST